METSEVSPRVECTLQRLENLISQIRRTGNLGLLAEMVRIIIKAQRQLSETVHK
jgi:hypothetical protein